MFDTIIPMIIGLAVGFSLGAAVIYFYDSKLLSRSGKIIKDQKKLINSQKELNQSYKEAVVMQKSYINALENKINFSNRKNEFEQVGNITGDSVECGYFKEF